MTEPTTAIAAAAAAPDLGRNVLYGALVGVVIGIVYALYRVQRERLRELEGDIADLQWAARNPDRAGKPEPVA